jgi:hypothetical protein
MWKTLVKLSPIAVVLLMIGSIISKGPTNKGLTPYQINSMGLTEKDLQRIMEKGLTEGKSGTKELTNDDIQKIIWNLKLSNKGLTDRNKYPYEIMGGTGTEEKKTTLQIPAKEPLATSPEVLAKTPSEPISLDFHLGNQTETFLKPQWVEYQSILKPSELSPISPDTKE